MKNNLKLFIGILIGIATTGIVYAVSTSADSISYNNGTVKDALDYLYSAPQIQKFCEYQDNTYVKEENKSDMYAIATKYRCQVNNNDTYNFYILSVNNEQVELIMDRNITQNTNQTTMSWANAMKYVKDNNLKSSWSNVLDINLPSVQDIANAVGNENWNAAANSDWWCLETKTKDQPSGPKYCLNNTTTKLWLWDNTRECQDWGCSNNLGSTEAYGYWTRDAITGTSNAWIVNGLAQIGYDATSNTSNRGVRPVITVLKSNLYKSN